MLLLLFPLAKMIAELHDGLAPVAPVWSSIAFHLFRQEIRSGPSVAFTFPVPTILYRVQSFLPLYYSASCARLLGICNSSCLRKR